MQNDLEVKLNAQKGLTKISLVDMFIGDEGAYLLSDFLRQNNQVEYLETRGNNISSSGFAAICESLKHCSRIKTITAEWNNIGSDTQGIVALHEVARSATSLQMVDLRNNHLNVNCAGAIASIIRDNNSIQTLDLRWNDLGNDGGKTILNALRNSNKKLQIDLNGNKIHEEILSEIAYFDPFQEQSLSQQNESNIQKQSHRGQ